MSRRANTPCTPTAGKHTGAQGTANEQLQIAALVTKNDTTTEPSDALQNQWAHIVAVMDANPDAFAAYVAAIRERIARSHGRWVGGTDYLRHFLRDGRFVTPDGDTFKVTHGYDTVWCREICHRWPDIAPHVLPTLRASRFDVFYPELFDAGR